MNYDQTLAYLYSQLPMFQRIGPVAYKSDLSNTHEICRILGHPEQKFPAIHIAGTNGKGSVSHLIASVLQEAGYKTGLFTSPHLKDFRERIRVDGRMIPKKAVTDFVARNRDRFEPVKASFFEYTFGLCMDYFADQKIDIAVVEVGMGGRLDSTNVVKPLISVITNIGLDHTQFLGDTLPLIAREKGGIIKPGIPLVVGETQKETETVFKKMAGEKGSEITFADQKYQIQVSDFNNSLKIQLIPTGIYDVLTPFYDIICPLAGHYQAKNVATAIVVLEKFRKDHTLEEQHIYNGIRNVIKNTGILGRWQTLQCNPRIICDTGHNIDGIRGILLQLQELDYRKLHIVLGMVNDKNINPVLELFPERATYYFCKADIPRGLNQDELMNRASQYDLKGKSYNSVKLALNAARDHAHPDDLIFVGGSTFVVAEVV